MVLVLLLIPIHQIFALSTEQAAYTKEDVLVILVEQLLVHRHFHQRQTVSHKCEIVHLEQLIIEVLLIVPQEGVATVESVLVDRVPSHIQIVHLFQHPRYNLVLVTLYLILPEKSSQTLFKLFLSPRGIQELRRIVAVFEYQD